MSRSRRQKRTHDGLTCVAVNGLLDSLEAAMVAATCKTLRSAFWDTPSVAEHVWASLCFRGPFPFGVRSCGTALGHSGRMMVPALLEVAVQKQGSVVRTLRINDCLFNDSALCAVLRNCTNVTNLNLGQSDHRYLLNQPVFSSVLTSGSLVNLRHCHSLVTLHLQHTFISDRGLAVLADSLKLLRHIDLACCMNLSALSFLELLKLPKLHHVGLRATNVSDYVVSNLVLTLEGLLHLDVSYCPRVSNNALVNLGQMLKCKTMPHQGAHVDSNPLVFKVMSSCVSLATASMGVFGTDAAWEPPDASLSGDGAAGGPRDAVDADSSKFMSFEDDYSDDDGGDEALAKLRPASVSVGRAASDMADGTDEFVGVRFRLQTLLMKAVNVNYITLAYIARFFPDLRRLDLSASRHLNTLPFRALALSCTSLEALEFRGCTRVDDESLVYIFSSASRYTLKHLNLRGCSRLTDKAFSYMFNNCAQLSSLNIVDCGRISDMSVTKLTGLLLLTRLEIGSSSSAPSHVNPDVTPRAVNQWLNGRACGYQLVVLRLFSTAVDDLVLSVISQRCHKLRELYVQDMPAVVKQRVVKDIVWEGVVEDRKCVTSRGLYHLAFGVCTSLTRLQLSCCDAIDTEGIMFLSDHPPPRLVDVQFTNCKGVGLRALQTIGASGFGQRQLKRLSMCDDPCSTVLEGLRAVMASSFSLELLEVRNCKLVPALENPATQAMLRSLPRLPPSLEWYPLLPSVSVTTDFE